MNAVCKDFVKPKRRAAKETTTQSYSNFGMESLFELLSKVTISKDFKYGHKIAAKESH